MTAEQINELAGRLEQANARRDYSLYNHLLRTVPQADRQAVEQRVRELARERMLA